MNSDPKRRKEIGDKIRAAREKFNELFEEELMKMFAARTKFYQKMVEDKALKEAMADKFFQEMYKRIKLK